MQTWIFQIKRQDGYKTAEWTMQEMETLEFEEVIISFTIADPTHNSLFASAADDEGEGGDDEEPGDDESGYEESGEELTFRK